MKILPAMLAVFLLASSPTAYFKYERPVQFSGEGQRFVPVDESIWTHTRGHLGELRLYSGETEVPYSLLVESGGLEHDRKDLRVLQQSTVRGKTQFLIDMSGLAQYDHVDLKLARKNFVAHAKTEGQDDAHARTWSELGGTILYDLSQENLGSNSMLRLPRSTYKYLRVTIDGPVTPHDIQGATSEMAEERPAVWRDLSSSPTRSQDGKDTVFTFAVDEKIPVERMLFMVDSAQPNFRREVEIRNGADVTIGTGEIERIHTVRMGEKIDSERQDVGIFNSGQGIIKVVIHNGDDRPLHLSGARLQQLERRLYFDAPAQGQFILYYGDEKLESPVYDYAKLFQRDKAAIPAQLGAEFQNPNYSPRPDDRPWSERHPAVLWIAIVVAVIALGSVALRSMRMANAQP